MLNIDDSFNLNNVINLDYDSIITPEQLYFNYDVDGIPDDGIYLVPMAENTEVKSKKPRKNKMKRVLIKKNEKKYENMENYSIYHDKSKPNIDLISQFKKENCIKDELKYKDITVKNDMAEHVFSVLAFENGQPCNPCSSTCKYSIIEDKIDTEEKLKPISTTQ